MPDPLPSALVLAAGLGRRLAPLTDVRAKPAVPVAGRPLVLRILDWLAAEGVADVVLNLHHRPETITRVVGHGAAAGLRVRYSWEPEVLGSAGGPRQALPCLGPRFFLVNGDTLTDVALRPLLEAHRRAQAAVTLAVTAHPDPARYGGVLVADDGRVTGFARAAGGGSEAGGPPVGGVPAAHFTGVQVAEAEVFAPLPAGRPAASIGGLYDGLVHAADGGGGREAAPAPGGLRAHRVPARFLDAGTPDDYLRACLAVAAAEGRPAPAPGADGAIHPDAVLTRTVVWDRVTVSAGCRLEECILADDVRLPAGVELRRAVCVALDPEEAEQGPGPGGRVVGNARVSPLDRPPPEAP